MASHGRVWTCLDIFAAICHEAFVATCRLQPRARNTLSATNLRSVAQHTACTQLHAFSPLENVPCSRAVLVDARGPDLFLFSIWEI